MTFTYDRIIRVQDTDATGCLYFANQLQIALEGFEEFLRISDFSLTSMMQEKIFLLPIVHTEADFFHPVTLGEKIMIKMAFTRIGTTSFTHSSELFREDGLKVAAVSIVHVVYSLKRKESIPIPDNLKKLFLK